MIIKCCDLLLLVKDFRYTLYRIIFAAKLLGKFGCWGKVARKVVKLRAFHLNYLQNGPSTSEQKT